MDGKVCMVTGASWGMGRVIARELARRGATVVMVSRDGERAREALAAVRGEGVSGRAELMPADLSSAASIRALADAFLARFDRLHVLVNNAGAYNVKRQSAEDGLELTFALNHMGYFRLTTRLLELMVASAPARIVNVSSGAHKGVGLDFDDLQATRRYGGFQAYGRSKLANILFTRELARRLAGTGVTVNAAHPGLVRSGFGGNNPMTPSLAIFNLMGKLFGRTPEKGAETAIYLASSPEVEGITGGYFADCRDAVPSEAARDEAAARRLWEVSESLAWPTR